MAIKFDRSQTPHPDWYLVANQGQLSIRINGSIALGESDRGLLLLESRNAAERWLELSLDDQGQLLLEYPANTVRVEMTPGSAGIPGPVTLERGTLLSFPHNEIYIGNDLQRGKVECTLSIKLSDTGLLPVEIPELTDVVSSREDSATPTLEPITVTVEVEAANDAMHTGKRGWQSPWVRLIGGLACLLALAGVAAAYFSEYEPTAANNMQAAKSPAAPPVQAPQALPQQTESEQTAAHTATNAAAASAKPVRLPESQAEMSLVEVRNLTAAEPLDEIEKTRQSLDAYLALADKLLADGYIVWPAQNAVAVLTEAQQHYPDAVSIRERFDEAAAQHLDAAQRAYDDGFTEAALKMVVQVRDINPEYEPAERMVKRLLQSP